MADSDVIRATPGLKESEILFTINATIRINAPPKHVFDVITKLESYSEWNQDTPKMELQGAETLREGSNINMKVIMVEQKREYNVPIEILRFENPNSDGVYVIAWRGKMLPSWFATTERVQEIHPVEGDANACEVQNYESMAGWGSYVFKYIMGIPAQMKNFNAKYLEELKARAEQTFN